MENDGIVFVLEDQSSPIRLQVGKRSGELVESLLMAPVALLGPAWRDGRDSSPYSGHIQVQYVDVGRILRYEGCRSLQNLVGTAGDQGEFCGS